MRWNKSVSYLYYTLLVVYVGSVIPMVWIGMYNWPSVDDFSMALDVREAFLATGSFPSTLMAGFTSAYRIYTTWIGYYFSDFVTAMAPSVYGEQYYAWVTVIILVVFTFSMLYFFHALFTKLYGVRWHLAGSVALLVMMLIVQCMPEGETTRVEAFYWWSGACNYMFMWSLGVLWCGLLISCVCDEGRRRVWEYFCACVLGLLLGGANYMTGLTLAMVGVLCVVWKMVAQRSGSLCTKALHSRTVPSATQAGRTIPALPCLLQLIGFAAACLAPGNQIRGAFGQGMPAVKSIMVSLYYTLDYCVDDWTTWPVLCMLLLIMLLLWKVVGEMDENDTEERFSVSIKPDTAEPSPVSSRRPLIVFVLAYGLISANMTPILFTRGDIGSGRMQSIIWAQYILLLVLTIAYLMAYAAQVMRRRHVLRLTADELRSEQTERMLRRAGALLVVFFLFGSALCVIPNPHYYTATSAMTDLMNGTAVQYRAESWERLRILQDESVTDAVLSEYQARPRLLYFSDVFKDETEWVNTATAKYYHKATVRITDDR